MPPQDTATTWWLTGLPGAGKSTLAQALAAALRARGEPACVVDGDELRSGLCHDLGFDAASRAENVRRAAQVARLLNTNGIHAIVALASPAADARALAYAAIGQGHCIEIHVSTLLEVCEKRDSNGLYVRAHANNHGRHDRCASAVRATACTRFAYRHQQVVFLARQRWEPGQRHYGQITRVCCACREGRTGRFGRRTPE